MREALIAGNWKMHKVPSEAVDWLGRLTRRLGESDPLPAELLLCVSPTHLAPMARQARGSAVRLGGQDLSAFDSGAYTGEVSGPMLRDAGAEFVIVGHSERRAYHGEDDQLVAAKLRAAHRSALVPILCVGESEAERDSGRAEEVVLGQLAAALEGLRLEAAEQLVVAYEPVWAIGTGRTATAQDAQQMAAALRRGLTSRFPALGERIRVLYGGSMKPDNAAELLAQADIDGGLVGGASLDVDSLLAIARAA